MTQDTRFGLDQQMADVWDFHTAFNCHVAGSPSFPPLVAGKQVNVTTRIPADNEILDTWAGHLTQLGRDLKQAAAMANLVGRPGLALLLIRLQLLTEEVGELAQSMADQDMLEALDALSDIGYVLAGSYLTLGLQHHKREADQIVHASNMSKLGPDGRPIIHESGRVMKGPGYQPPTERLRALLGQ
jgi:hypothetical protein